MILGFPKFFATVDHQVLLALLRRKINDEDILRLLSEVISSFHAEFGSGKGIPLGNLTSQVFANIYLNELDQLVKQKLKIKYYLRYADDFLMISKDRHDLDYLIEPLRQFLQEKLKLEPHPKKVILRGGLTGILIFWGILFCLTIFCPEPKPKEGFLKS